MKDIDFDELDRAVNSLMNTEPKDKAASESSQQAPQNISTDPTASSPQQDAGDAEAIVASPDSPQDDQPKAEQESAPMKTPAARRGRFMDVVRPSSRGTRKSSSAASRHGKTLQPVQSTDTTAAAPSTEAVSAPSEEPSEGQSAPVDTGPEFESAVPDISIEPATGPEQVVEESTPEAADETAPLASPFIPDAKVEKRPLGRPTEVTPLSSLATELAANTGTSEAPTQQSSDETEAEGVVPATPDVDAQLPEQPLPAELGSELLSIESDASTLPLEAPSVAPVMPAETPEVPATPASDNAATPAATPSPMPSPSPVPDPTRTTAQAIAAASIPQQYKVQSETSTEAPTGGIYDAQPLMHPADKKPGWMLVVAVIAILLLGAAGGAAVYYLGLL